jgi:hypothetical protein
MGFRSVFENIFPPSIALLELSNVGFKTPVSGRHNKPEKLVLTMRYQRETIIILKDVKCGGSVGKYTNRKCSGLRGGYIHGRL